MNLHIEPLLSQEGVAPDWSGKRAQAAAPQAAGTPPEAPSLTREEAEKLAGEVQSTLLAKGVELTIKVLDGEKGIQVEIRDAASDKLIRKSPPDELLELAESLRKSASGLLDKPA